METILLTNEEKLFIKSLIYFEFYSIARNELPEHSHEFYEVFLVVKNSANHYLNGKKYFLKESDLVLIRPGESHRLENFDENDCRFVNISFHHKLFNELMNFINIEDLHYRILNLEVPVQVSLTQKEKMGIERKLLNLANSSAKENTFINLKLILTQLLMHISTNMNDQENSLLPDWLEKILIEYRNQYYFIEGHHKLYEISEKTPEHICRVFKQYLNQTPTAYTNELRLTLASNLLQHSNFSVTEVGLTVGFENLSHFHHLFKKKFKVSPKQFKLNTTDPESD